jgi:signal transduction histidine kinase
MPRAVAKVIAAGQAMSINEKSRQGDRFLRTYIPVAPNGTLVGVLEISESLSQMRKFISNTVLRIIATTVVMIIICVAATFFLGFILVGRPVKKLVAKARRIGQGDFSEPLEFKNNDEIADLAREMNSMAEHLQAAIVQIESETSARLDTVEQLRHVDRLKTVGQLTSGVVHEIGTPLTVISGRAKMISSGEVEGEEARECARIVVKQTERVTKTIRQILDFARRGERRKEVENINLIAREMTRLLEPVAVKRGVYLNVPPEEEPFWARIDRSQIEQVLANLIVNAIQAARAGGRVSVEVSRVETAPGASADQYHGPYWALTVQDDGEGIAPDVMPYIFEPFFTTKTSGNGTGLGLAISREIVREHKGSITVESDSGLGSRFTIYLPIETSVS